MGEHVVSPLTTKGKYLVIFLPQTQQVNILDHNINIITVNSFFSRYFKDKDSLYKKMGRPIYSEILGLKVPEATTILPPNILLRVVRRRGKNLDIHSRDYCSYRLNVSVDKEGKINEIFGYG